jgi:RimJ/RimL family protein N-acetyltransferase
VDDGEQGYPAHWEADVVLRDGGTAHLRPILPTDADRLRRFYDRLSDETIYNRFFSLYRNISDRDVERFTVVDHHDRAALIATIGTEMIGVVRYERIDADEAEVAFNIEDAHQGRGLGSVFLEHIAAAARERGISRFVADVLPANRKMLRVFSDAGYVVDQAVRRRGRPAVLRPRAHRGLAGRHLRPRAPRRGQLGPAAAAAGLGGGRRRRPDRALGGSRGASPPARRGLHRSGPRGQQPADEVAGLPSYRSVRDVPGRSTWRSSRCRPTRRGGGRRLRHKGVRGLVVMATGFAETGPEGVERQRRLVALARGSGMRVLGPSSFGVINTDPDVSLNASLSPLVPPRGALGFFSQSGRARGRPARQRRTPGARPVDVRLGGQPGRRQRQRPDAVLGGGRGHRGRDALPRVAGQPTQVQPDRAAPRPAEARGRREVRAVPRRCAGRPPGARLARPCSGGGRLVPPGRCHPGRVDPPDVRRRRADRDPAAAGRTAGGTAGQLRRARAARGGRLRGSRAGGGGHPRLGPDADAAEFAAALDEVFADDGVDSVVALFIPPLRTRDAEVAEVLASASRRGSKTVVSTFLGMPGVPDVLRAPGGDRGSVPSYSTPEDAVVRWPR